MKHWNNLSIRCFSHALTVLRVTRNRDRCFSIQRSRASADKARAANTTPSKDMEHGEETTVLVSNFIHKERSLDDFEERLGQFFGPCGHIVEIRLPTSRHSIFLRGYAFIRFDSEEAAHAAVQMSAVKKMERRRLRIRIAVDGSLIR